MKTWLFFVLFLMILLQNNGLNAQSMGGGMGGNGRIDGKVKFLPIPYVNYDRSLGFTAGALPMFMFNPVATDTISPSSLVGALGMYTSNESWFGMMFGSFYFNQDRWRVKTAAGVGAFNFQFYLDGIVDGWIPYNTAVDFVYAGVQRKVWNHLYTGVSYYWVKYNTELETGQTQEANLNGLGLNVTMDTRTNVYYPRNGYESSLKFFTFPAWGGNEFISNKIETYHNHYFSIRDKKDVIAARYFGGLGIGDMAFAQQFIVGNTDLRGYTQGEYRGNYQLAVQGEYRWNPFDKLSFVGFAGVATVFDGVNASDNGKLLPAAGTGFRVLVSEDTNFKVGLDAAVGVNDWGVYFRVGEAF